MKLTRLARRLLPLVFCLAAQAAHAESLTFLLPAPPALIAFAPFTLAASQKYFAQAGLDVRFVTVGGGAEVGRQLAAGNGDLGLGLGDTPIVLRANGIPVQGVALLGGRPLHQLVVRKDRGIDDPSRLKGRTLTVISYQDTSYFTAMAVLAHAGLTRKDTDIEAAGPAGTWQLVAQGKSDGLVGPPEWGYAVEDAGVKVDMTSTAEYFPGMAQAVMASDAMIASRPETVARFVQALLRALDDIKRDPQAAARAFIAARPSYRGQEASVARIFAYYAANVYSGQPRSGEFDRARIAQLQQYYLDKQIIRRASKVDELFTNQFLPSP